jgi:hypothetical protein
MSRAKELAALGRIAGLIRDLHLADLARANAARQASLDMLAGLEPKPAVGLDAIAEAQAGLRYQIWADQRRAEIEPMLLRQTKTVNDATDVARQAFGRAEVLRTLSIKVR